MFRLVPVLILATLTTSAFAAEPVTYYRWRPHPAVATFESLDRNADQQVSRSEAGFDVVMSDVFADLDTDGDGYVSKVEFAAMAKKLEVASR